jgi:hypothetical protein
MLPIHWLLCRGSPNVDILLLVVEEYREGLLDTDYAGRTPLMRYLMNADKDVDLESLLSELTEMTREERVEKQKLLPEQDNFENKKHRSHRSKNGNQSSPNRLLRRSPSRK